MPNIAYSIFRILKISNLNNFSIIDSLKLDICSLINWDTMNKATNSNQITIRCLNEATICLRVKYCCAQTPM